MRQRDELVRVKAEMSLGDSARSLGRAATVAEAAAPDQCRALTLGDRQGALHTRA